MMKEQAQLIGHGGTTEVEGDSRRQADMQARELDPSEHQASYCTA